MTHNPPKFALGDVVWVNRSKSNRFMPCECKAIVIWYAEVSGMFMYSLLIKNSSGIEVGTYSWYYECDLEYRSHLPRENMRYVMDYENDPSVAKEILADPPPGAISLDRYFEKIFAPSKPMRKSRRSIEREIRGLMARIRRHDRVDKCGYVDDCLNDMSCALTNWRVALVYLKKNYSIQQLTSREDVLSSTRQD